MQSDWFLYAPEDQLNEATRFYVNTVMAAGRALGRTPRHVGSLRALPLVADVLAVECKSAFKLCMARRDIRMWLWIQGIVPEEARLQHGSRWRESIWTFFERTALPRAAGVLMVSNSMREHFGRKYGYSELPSFVMPCANALLDPSSFQTPRKYVQPRFVYAGSMHKWQCFDLTLDVYQRVKVACPTASLSVLTHEKDKARAAIEASGATDVDIDFVPLEQLQARLANYKYGFVLRTPHVVNSVATPTKVSSYMAAGVIPVMTSAVDDYVAALRGIEPIVMSDRFDAGSIAQAVLDVETRELRSDDVLRSYTSVFSRYFDHAAYHVPLREFLRSTGLEHRSAHDLA